VAGGRLVLVALIVTAAVPAGAFALGGIAKLDDPLLAAQFIGHVLSVRLDHAFDLTRAIAVCELVLAAGICLSLGRRRWPAYSGMCLLAFFIGMLLVVQLRDPQAASCGCFGGLMGRLFLRSLWTQIGIDLGLMVSLAMHLVLSYAQSAGSSGPGGIDNASSAAPD